MKKSKLIIPKGIEITSEEMNNKNFNVNALCFIPLPESVDTIKGFYVTLPGLVKLLRANKNRPESIQYIADMLE